MISITWPPEFDGIKIERDTVLCRIKNTDIWIEFNIRQHQSLEEALSDEMRAIILAWRESLDL